VDYYVTAVFFSSLIMACVVRQFQPYKIMRIAYTETMWATGVDSFFDQTSQTFREIDLYEWIHLPQLARAHHLKGYAQGLSPEVIKKELEKQETSRKALKDALKDAKSKEDLEKPKVVDDNKRKMKEQYYNEHADVVVKLVREITVSTVSPPHKGNDDIQRGTVVFKEVEVRRDAVGTIIGQVNADVVKIRFPKKVPESPPVMENFLPRVSFEEAEGGKKKPICFDNGLPIALIDATEKFNPDDKNVFATVKDPNVRENFNAGLRKFNARGEMEFEHQYHMFLTPTFENKTKRKEVNAWLHNAALRMVKPQPRHMKKDDDDLKKDDDDYERKSVDEATDWEDVDVPLANISETSEKWGVIEKERARWMRKHEVVEAADKEEKK